MPAKVVVFCFGILGLEPVTIFQCRMVVSRVFQIQIDIKTRICMKGGEKHSELIYLLNDVHSQVVSLSYSAEPLSIGNYHANVLCSGNF